MNTRLWTTATLLALVVGGAAGCATPASDTTGASNDAVKVSPRVEPGTFKLDLAGEVQVDPSCDTHTRLTLRNDPSAEAELEETVEGTCKLDLRARRRSYGLSPAPTDCGSRVWEGQWVDANRETHRIRIEDHRSRTCNDWQRSHVVVTESVPAKEFWPGASGTIESTLLARPDAASDRPREVQGKLLRFANGTKFGIDDGGLGVELDLTDETAARAFVEGRVARATGVYRSVMGPAGLRPVLLVRKLLVCPAPGRMSNLVPPHDADTGWLGANCPIQR